MEATLTEVLGRDTFEELTGDGALLTLEDAVALANELLERIVS